MKIGENLLQAAHPAWYSVRTKPKHEHIAAANLRGHLALPVFFPRIRLEKLTRRGLIRVAEPLFPCYIFTSCVVSDHVNEIQHLSGVSRLVQFGGKYPPVADAIIEELQACFGLDDFVSIESRLTPGDEVTVAAGVFAGMSAQVLISLPAKKRVRILLEILGRPTLVDVGTDVVIRKKNALADLAPFLAAPVGQNRWRA
jgi:transcriptional antiterminator RfaH